MAKKKGGCKCGKVKSGPRKGRCKKKCKRGKGKASKRKCKRAVKACVARKMKSVNDPQCYAGKKAKKRFQSQCRAAAKKKGTCR